MIKYDVRYVNGLEVVSDTLKKWLQKFSPIYPIKNEKSILNQQLNANRW